MNGSGSVVIQRKRPLKNGIFRKLRIPKSVTRRNHKVSSLPWQTLRTLLQKANKSSVSRHFSNRWLVWASQYLESSTLTTTAMDFGCITPDLTIWRTHWHCLSEEDGRRSRRQCRWRSLFRMKSSEVSPQLRSKV